MGRYKGGKERSAILLVYPDIGTGKKRIKKKKSAPDERGKRVLISPRKEPLKKLKGEKGLQLDQERRAQRKVEEPGERPKGMGAASQRHFPQKSD